MAATKKVKVFYDSYKKLFYFQISINHSVFLHKSAETMKNENHVL